MFHTVTTGRPAPLYKFRTFPSPEKEAWYPLAVITYFYTSSEILGLIGEKHRELPEDVGLDASTAESFHRTHTAFERELHLLGEQVPLVPSCPSTLPLTSIPGTL